MSERGPLVREVVTPEGVPLRFTLAAAGDRIGAFAIDCTILGAASAGILVLAVLATIATRGLGIALGLLAFFLLRNFYFTWFECRAAGATPGKRLLGLRVIDAHGGMLSPEAVFARNFMREIELFVPLAAVLAPDELLPGVPFWARGLALAWLFVFALLPLFNRERLRVGDIVAGTLVVLAPKAVLLEDLSAAPATGETAPPDIAFSPAQLDLYGIRELQVLETLLRHKAPRRSAVEAVAEKIQRKIAWRPTGDRVDPEAFLRAFYTAQRARLEQRMLLGDRREAKRPGGSTRRP